MRAPNVTFLARARGPAHPSAAALAPGVLAAALVVALAGFAATGLWRAVERFDLSVITAPYVLHALRFTFAQAALSTLVSVVLGALLALALARRRFPLRGLVRRALGVSFVLPAIAAVFGIVALHGRSGFVSVALQSLGFAPASYLYGLPGIVLAHVFFNIPFAARGFLGALEAVPDLMRADHFLDKEVAALDRASRQIKELKPVMGELKPMKNQTLEEASESLVKRLARHAVRNEKVRATLENIHQLRGREAPRAAPTHLSSRITSVPRFA